MTDAQAAPATPAIQDLQALPTAADVVLANGDLVWYYRGASSAAPVVAGTFYRYGTIRCAIYVMNAAGWQIRRWVMPRNVYRQAEPGKGIRSDGW